MNVNFLKSIFKYIIHKPHRIILASFVIVIFIGSLLLYSSMSLAEGNKISFIDALFTSTSATCVTGLIVVDTGSYFSTAGQIIILLLIQVGGLGVMTFSTLFLFYFRGKIGISGREIMQETISSISIIDTGHLLKSVFIFTFIIEMIGASLLSVRFMFDMPFGQAVYTAVFHSISAFCNAGFSTFSDSLILYRSDIFVNIIIITLIICGGLGFIVIYEIMQKRKNQLSFHKLSLHSKIVLSYSAAFILLGAIFILIFEYNVSMKEYSFPVKAIASIFQSVTARTAGFNTIDLYSFSLPSIMVLITLMFIGASPASCGGGVKTTTVAVIFAFIRSRIKDQKNVNLFYNTLPFRIISKAIVIMVFGIITVIIFSFLVSIFELGNTSFSNNGNLFVKIIFEVVSAFGTVGLSTGITPDLSQMSRVLIIILMIFGRVGPLTIAISLGAKDIADIKYVEEDILIG